VEPPQEGQGSESQGYRGRDSLTFAASMCIGRGKFPHTSFRPEIDQSDRHGPVYFISLRGQAFSTPKLGVEKREKFFRELTIRGPNFFSVISQTLNDVTAVRRGVKI
jgi:hypothetical protein